jgi:manganese efflux pump family protein
MDAWSLILLSVGLAMDATAVSATRGLTLTRIEPRHLGLVGVFFGGSQALMPIVGYGLGASVGQWVKAWQHWLVFALLAGLGARMLREGFRRGEVTGPDRAAADAQEVPPVAGADAFALPVMLGLALATSIDALAAGITLPLLGAPLIISSLSIGLVTAALSMFGLWVGRRFGDVLGHRLDVVGGLTLIALGTKALIEHLWHG